jgi:hypothetical protein
VAVIRLRAFLLVGAFMVALTCLAASAAAGPVAPTPCTIALTIEPKNRDAAVNSTSPDAVSFNGNYTVSLPPLGERATLTFTAVVDTGWVSTVSPSSITITNQRSGTITITVVAPAGARPSDVGTLTVTARMTAAGLQCQDVESGLTITPLPYFDALVGSMAPAELKVKNGLASFTITMGAVASVPVAVAIECVGPEGASFLGVTMVSLPDPAVAAPNATVTIKVQAPNLAPGVYQVQVRIVGTTSTGLSKQGTMAAPLIVPEAPDVLSSPLLPLVGAAAAVGVALFWWRRR